MFRRRPLFLLMWLVLLFCETNLITRKCVFGETFNEVWDQNTLHWLLEKRYCSAVCIVSICYVQAEDSNTRLHETLSTEYLVTLLTLLYFFIILVYIYIYRNQGFIQVLLMMSVLWKKIEFYKEESNSEVNVITAGGLLWAGCCKPPLADRFFHYGGTSVLQNFPPPYKSLSSLLLP